MKINKLLALACLFLGAVGGAADKDSAPKKKKLSLQDILSSSGGSKRTTSVAGVRGLDEQNGPVDTAARDFAAIDKLERVVIHEDELKKFIEEGKL